MRALLGYGKVGLTVWLVSSAAVAQTESIALDYREHDGCPARARFEAEVRARTQKVKWQDLEATRRFRVTFSERDGEFAGKLEIVSGDGGATEREISGTACDDVASGLALVLALAVDPDASTAPVSELSLPDVEPEPSQPKAPPAAPSPAPPPPSPAPPAAGTRMPPAPGITWGLGADALFLWGPAPKALSTGALQLDLDRRGWGRASVRILAADSEVVGPSSSQAKFRFLAAQLAICPLALAPAAALSFAGCATALGGSLGAEGRGVALPGSARRAFVAAGVEASFRVYPTPKFYVGSLAGALANITQDDFVFENPHIVVHSVPAASFALGLQLGVSNL